MTDAIVLELEEDLRRRARALVDPREGECLLCFIARALQELGCDTSLRWATRYRDLRAPRATGLERRLGNVGGFCDCEVFLNGFALTVRPLPACRDTRRGSTRPCPSWVRRGRGW